MDFFMLSYTLNYDYNKFHGIKRILTENNLKQCYIVIFWDCGDIEYLNLKKFIECANNFFVDTRIHWKLMIKSPSIDEQAIELLRAYRIGITFIINEYNLFTTYNRKERLSNIYDEHAEYFNIYKNKGIDYDALVIFSRKMLNHEINFTEWIIKNDLHVTIIPEKCNDTDNDSQYELNKYYTDFIKASYKLLHRNQHFKLFNPITNNIPSERIKNSTKYKYNYKIFEEDYIYCYINDHIDLNFDLFLEDNNFTNEDAFLRYKTKNKLNFFATSEFKRELYKIYDFLKEEAVQDLASSFIERQANNQLVQTIKNEEYDMVLSICYRSQDRSKRVPMGLSCLAAYIEKFGYTSKVLDISSHNLINVFKNELEANKTKIIGFYCSCDNEILVRNIIKYLKINKYGVITLVGGPQAVALDEEFLRSTGCDVVTEGEGEEALKELLDYYIKKQGNLKDIKNIKFIDENDIYHQNEMRQPIQDLDSLPFPKYNYDEQTESRISNLAGILTGRGCPFHCAFCYEGAHAKTLRYRSLPNVFEEINQLVDANPKLWFLQIYDDTFTLDHNRVLEFCEGMKKIREKRKLQWCCEAHVNTLIKNPKIISHMIDAGLHSMQIGIESGSKKVLKAYNKNTTPEMIYDIVKICKDYKLRTLEGNIIVGGAWESNETLEESIEMAKKLLQVGRGMLEMPTVLYWPFPKTPMSSCPQKFGMEILNDMVEKSIAALNNAVISTVAFTREEIINGKRRIDKVIDEEYRRLSIDLDKETVKKFWNPLKGQKIKGSRWADYIFEYEHYRKYCAITLSNDRRLEGMDDLEKIYPIRTFELLEYVDNCIYAGGMNFESIKMKILEYSTGRHNISQIAQKLNMDFESVINVCNELENKCFLYYSNF